MAHPFGHQENVLQHIGRCIDDNASLERRVVIAYTKQNKTGVGLPSLEYCPKCRKYLDYSGKMEEDISKIVLDFFMKYSHSFKPEYLIKTELVKK
jgi:hypothetical protein